MSGRVRMKGLVRVLVIAFLAGCGRVPTPPPPPPVHNPGDPITEIGPLEGAVIIVAWPGYIERGANDSNYDWVTKFETDTGCAVQTITASTSDEMVALMNAGGVD